MLKKIIVKSLIFFCKIFSKNDKKIVYHSFPDFSDNSFAMFIYVIENHKEFKNIWLVDNDSYRKDFLNLISNYTDSLNFEIIKKKSLKGFYSYFTANIILHTHGLYNILGLIDGQKKVNLWHGMPIKCIGHLDKSNNNKVQPSNFHTATSKFYQKIISKAFGVSTDRVLVVGQVRNDFLLDSKFSIHQLYTDKNEYKKTVLWMPTYRKSIIGDIRADGEVKGENDFFNTTSLKIINKLFKEHNSICYVKLHPMDYRNADFFKHFSNIRFIDNFLLERKGLNMYSLFDSVDVLLTDFSSVYIDFLILNRPIGFVFSDYEVFKSSRGFLFSDPIKYMPGEIITTLPKLEAYLLDIFNSNKDLYVKKRNAVKKEFHKYENNFSKFLFKQINDEI